MQKIIKRSNLKRKLMFSFEKNKQIYKSLTNNYNLNKVTKWNADLNIFKRSVGIVQLTKRCIITGRKNILNGRYKLSRLIFLKYSRNGSLVDLIKSVW